MTAKLEYETQAEELLEAGDMDALLKCALLLAAIDDAEKKRLANDSKT